MVVDRKLTPTEESLASKRLDRSVGLSRESQWLDLTAEVVCVVVECEVLT